MSKRKRDKARLQRQLQGTDVNILLGYPYNLIRTPEGSTSRYNGDPERIRSTWRLLQKGVTARGTTGALYAPPHSYREVTVLGEGTYLLVVEVKHAKGQFTLSFESATYSACARKAWNELRDMGLDEEHQTYVERNDHRTMWFMEIDEEIAEPVEA